MRTTNRLYPCFRKAEVPHLALLNQLLHRPGHVFDRHVRVDTVLIEEIDVLGLESLERALRDLLDVLWPTVQADPTLLTGGIELEAEFGGDHHSLAEGRQGFAHELLVHERAVHFGGIEERHAQIYRLP